jgi:tetratricopeptide (TPR) repeat protein
MVEAKQTEKSIFLAAVEIASDVERAAFIQQACLDNPQLRAEVDALLRAHAKPQPLLDAAPTPGPTIDEPISERPGTIIGPYKLLEQLGEGGFGVVFMAEQTQPIRRRVALKVIKPGMDSRQVIARFEAERQALALMDHPNIAHVFDGDATDSGRPYFVMELVRGRALTDYCDQNNLPIRERLELFIDVCQAVQHAHQKGIIHRDIKPSNVLVTLLDGKPVVKVIDFGIAKAMGQQLTEKTLFTNFAAMIGTPLYMSPEQAEMSGLDVDTRSDVYSLGVLLYELLTGTTPFDKERLKQASFDEIRRIIREEEPPKPSARISQSSPHAPREEPREASVTRSVTATIETIATRRRCDPRKLIRLFRGDLDWIVMKALEKDRNRRYESASSLAADVQRYLADEPVLACPPSAWYRLRKFVRRHKRVLGTAAAMLLAASVLGWTLWSRAEQEEARRAEHSLRLTETQRAVSVALARVAPLAEQARNMPVATSAEAAATLGVWREAEDALGQAAAALSAGTADQDLNQRVAATRRDLEQGRLLTERSLRIAQRKEKLFRDLDQARMVYSTITDGGFDEAASATKYGAAFMAYDLDADTGHPDELARQIATADPEVRQALVIALDDWAHRAARCKTRWVPGKLRALADAADDDDWRKASRAAWAARDKKALRDLSAAARQRSLPASSLVRLAINLYSLELRDEAVALLRWARPRHPSDFWVHYYLGMNLNLRQGRTPLELEEEIGCYRAALALRPDASSVHNSLGIALYQKKQLDEADAAFREALRLQPDAAAHCNLGIVMMERGRLDDALAEYREALHLNKDDPITHYNIGLVLQAKGKFEAAIAAYKEALRIRKDFAEAHHNLGNALQDLHRVDEAINEYQEALSLKKDLPEAHYNLGRALEAKGLADKAIVEYQEAIRLKEDFAEAHHNLGVALEAKGQVDQAIVEYQKAIRLKKDLAEAHNNLGGALVKREQWDAAIDEFHKALDLDRNFAPAHNGLGAALAGKNQLDAAIAEFRKAIEVKPKFGQNPANLTRVQASAHYNLGRALERQGRSNDAITAYREAIRLDPKLFEAQFALGDALWEKGAPQDAVEPFRRATELKPDDASSRSHLADVLRESGRQEEAMKAYAKALELWRQLAAGAPKVADYQSQIGATLHNLAADLLAHNKPAEAARLVEEAIAYQMAARKINPENKTYRLFLRNHYMILADTQVQLGKHVEAAKAAAEFLDLYPGRMQELVQAAAVLAQCSAAAADDGQLSEVKRKEVVNGYGERAVTLLRQAADKGWKNAAADLKAPVFGPLRSRDDFQKLLAELESKSKL